MAQVARLFFFSGRVQGVGFRYKTTELAQQLGLNGFVRNRKDGRVELYAEGEEQQIGSLLEALQQSFQEHQLAVEARDVLWEGRVRFEILR